jgi:hypothetical protein
MYSLLSYRQIEEKMENYMLSDCVYQIIESLTLKVGGNTSLVQKNVKESLVGLLNKLTNDTYATISTKILASAPSPETIEDIFKVAVNNMFYSKLYARLCSQLVSKNELLRPIVLDKCQGYIASVKEVGSKTRGTTLFVANLALNGTIPLSEGVRLGSLLQQYVEENMDGDEDIVAEWVEHLALLLMLNKTLTDACGLEERIRLLTEIDTSKHKGISLKTVFKYMDILEHFK